MTALSLGSINGTASATGTSSTQVIAGQTGYSVFVTALIVANTSATASYVKILDGSNTILIIPAPANNGSVVSFPTALQLTSGNTLNFASGANTTTMYVSAVGYYG